MNTNWQEIELGKVLKLEYGKPLADIKRNPLGKYPAYGANGIKDRTDEFYFNKKSIIVGRKGSAGEVNLTEEKFWPLDVTYFVKYDDKKYDLKFIYYLLVSLNLTKLAKGVKPGINRNEVYAIPVMVPSFSEQKCIVAILDKTFAAIDKAKENVNKNLVNTRELFENILTSAFSQKNSNWKSEKLVNITTKIGSGSTPRGGKKSYKTEGTALIRSMNVYDREFYDKNLAYIDDKQSDKLNNVELFKGDVLLNITGASIARSCVVPEKYLPARVNQHVSIIRSNSEIVNPKFLNYLLTSRVYKQRLLHTGDSAGATRQALTKDDLEKFQIEFPTNKNEQKLIADKLDSIQELIYQTRSILKMKNNMLDQLKKSILHKAFAGELTKAEIFA